MFGLLSLLVLPICSIDHFAHLDMQEFWNCHLISHNQSRSLIGKALQSEGSSGWFCNDRYHKQMTKGAADVCVEADRSVDYDFISIRRNTNSCT